MSRPRHGPGDDTPAAATLPSRGAWGAWHRPIDRLQLRVWSHPRYRGILLANCLIGMFATAFPSTILTVAVKRIAEDLHSTPSTVVWVTTAPLLAAAAATPVLGRLGDLRGHRRLFIAGFLTAIVFAVATAVATSVPWLIAARTLSQLGAAATAPAAYALLFRAYPPDERVKASSIASATGAGAAVIGVVIGGPIIDAIGWRPIFIIQAVIATAALLPALVIVQPDEPAEDVTVDYRGAVALATTVFCATFGVNRLAVWGPTPLVLASLVAVPAVLLVLVRFERAADSPIVPFDVLHSRAARWILVATFMIGAGWLGTFVITPLLFQSVLGYSVGMTSLLSVPRATCITLVSPIAGRLGVAHGERKVLLGATISLTGSWMLLAAGAAATSTAVLLAGLVLSGVAFGHIQGTLLSFIANTVEQRDLGAATSMQQTANQVGGVFGLGIITAVAADATGPGPFVGVYLFGAVLSIGAWFAIRQIRSPGGGPRRPRKSDPLAPGSSGDYVKTAPTQPSWVHSEEFA